MVIRSFHRRWLELVADSRRSELRLLYSTGTANGTAHAMQAIRLPERATSQLVLLHISRTSLGSRVCPPISLSVPAADRPENQTTSSSDSASDRVSDAGSSTSELLSAVTTAEVHLDPPIALPDRWTRRARASASRFGVSLAQRHGARSLYIVCKSFLADISLALRELIQYRRCQNFIEIVL